MRFIQRRNRVFEVEVWVGACARAGEAEDVEDVKREDEAMAKAKAESSEKSPEPSACSRPTKAYVANSAQL
jgi:hypothetical protein